MPAGPFHIPRRQTPDQINALFAAQRTGDPTGSRIHLILATGACLMAGWPTTFVEWGAAPVLLCFLIRMTGWHRILEPLAFDRVVRLVLAWGAWAALSLLWTVGRGRQEGSTAPAWLMDLRDLRFLAFLLVLWPVLDRRSLLIAALMAGIACGEASQFIHLTGKLTGWSWLPFHRASGRISGWWDPVSGGTVLCAGLGLWLAPALWGASTRIRWAGTIGALGTLACIGLTGTRGAWIGAAALVAITIGIRLFSRVARRKAIWPFGATVACACILAAAAAFMVIQSKPEAARTGITHRITAGIDDVRNSFGPEGWRTDTGLRIAMWQWAIAAWRTHPALGVGAGGYQPWVRSRTPEDAARLDSPAGAITGVHAQAHSTYFHTLATLGTVGFLLLVILLASTIFAGMQSPLAPNECLGPGGATVRCRGRQPTGGDPDPRQAPEGRQNLFLLAGFAQSIEAAPALALIGLACAGLFDTITVNQQPSYLLYLLIALCLPSRPREFLGSAVAPPRCVHCGYSSEGLAWRAGSVCPECGREIRPEHLPDTQESPARELPPRGAP